MLLTIQLGDVRTGQNSLGKSTPGPFSCGANFDFLIDLVEFSCGGSLPRHHIHGFSSYAYLIPVQAWYY